MTPCCRETLAGRVASAGRWHICPECLTKFIARAGQWVQAYGEGR